MNTTKNGNVIGGNSRLAKGVQYVCGKLSATDLKELRAVQKRLPESSAIHLLAQTSDLRMKQTSLKQQ